MRVVIFALFFLLLPSFCFGQQFQKVGKITAFGGFALQNVPVKARKSKQEVKTDSLGIFTILCEKNDVLIIRANQFKNERIRLKNNDADTLFVKLKFNHSTTSFEQLSQSGYLRNEDMSGAKSYYDKLAPDYCDFNNMYELIDVCCPGVKVDFGSSPPKVTLYSSSYSVMYVVDGVENGNINFLRPCDVTNIKVVKDAGSLAAYGTKGADGVVVIETK
jgi:TonB-dependent SusC/RagA subfamily outer membrane receptor